MVSLRSVNATQTAPKLSVVVPTRNERANVGACLAAFREAVARGDVECVVVDNASPDGTADLAREAGARVFSQGPERCAQRNRGFREAAAPWVMFVDADMRVPPGTLAEILGRIAAGGVDALYVREKRVGSGWRTKARDFERGFYDGTCIDGLRVFRKTLLEKTGGYDESLFACEDWDLDRRVLAAGARTAVTDGALLHDERRLSLRALLRKKRYYAGSFGAYRRKWGNDATTRRQFGFRYRFFGVFLENGKWRRVLRHPFLFATVMAERVAVGFVFLFARGGARRNAND